MLHRIRRVLSCRCVGDIHTVVEKTNYGGQQLAPLPSGATYIQYSCGYATLTPRLVPGPDVPGYETVFALISAANIAPGVCNSFAPLLALNALRTVHGLCIYRQIRPVCLCSTVQQTPARHRRRCMQILQYLASARRRNPDDIHMCHGLSPASYP